MTKLDLPAAQDRISEEPEVITEPPRAATHPSRIFVGATVTPEYLADLTKGHMQIHADKVRESYVGKWMAVSGTLGNVGGWTSFGDGAGFFNAVLDRKQASVILTFRDQSALRKNEAMRKGDRMAAVGQIKNIDHGLLALGDCEPMDPA